MFVQEMPIQQKADQQQQQGAGYYENILVFLFAQHQLLELVVLQQHEDTIGLSFVLILILNFIDLFFASFSFRLSFSRMY